MAKTRMPSMWIDYLRIAPEVISFDDLYEPLEDMGCYWRHKEAAEEENEEILLPPATHPRPLRF